MKVLFVAYEVYPFAKVGGLADVAGTLPKFLKKLGVDIELVMPYHPGIENKDIISTGLELSTTRVEGGYVFDIFESTLPGSDVRIFLLRNEELIDSTEIYGGRDLGVQAMAFCDAVTSFAQGRSYDVVHINDWQTALVAPYFEDLDESAPATLLTIHNLGYQGAYSPDYFYRSGLSDRFFTYEGVLHYGKFNFLKSGLIYADLLNTVSKAYAEEIQTEEYGAGLHEVLRFRKGDLFGVLNGIDYDIYDPRTDTRLPYNFSVNNIDGKAKCKSALQQELKLEVSDRPLISLISRLVHQKGLDILSDVINEIVAHGVQVAILGTGDNHFESVFRSISKRCPDMVSVNLLFDQDLAQRIYAGSDMFLMPSLYEPCGLGQMFSMRYGTIPVVRYTGGLRDTVKEFDEQQMIGNGFGFTDYSGGALLEAVKRAVSYYDRKDIWRTIIKNAMETDCSWNRSADEYITLYNSLMNMRKEKSQNA
ncbi:MAG TPA: glycogen synthase [Kosmotogaceae bacterium]|nr:MAG: Glycogen synthase [Thermotogales bacterium 46_20]HAA85482.1 glycogen synthase [Kosmotogaceae bacterium]